jgi:hypothetical protein
MTSVTYTADEIGLLLSLQPSKSLSFCRHSCYGGTISQQQVTVLLACNAEGSDNWQI